MNKTIFGTITMMFGFIIGLGFVLISKSLTLGIYKEIGIVRPICNDTVSCAYQALFNCSLYLIAIFSVVCLALSLGCIVTREFSSKQQGGVKNG